MPIEDCLEQFEDGKKIHQGWSPQCESHPSQNEEIWGVLKTTAIQNGYFLEQHNKELPSKFVPKPRIEVRPGDILMTCAGPRIRCGVVCLVKNTRGRLMISGKMYRFRANTEVICPSYLELFLRSKETQAAINRMKTGSSESGLNLTQDRFRELKVRLGELTEQQRIIAKVDELMALCDQLQAAQTEREQSRERLVAASMHSLNPLIAEASNTMEAKRENARFLLNLAISGSLVQQHTGIESSHKLLEQIRLDQEKTIFSSSSKKKGKTNKQDIECLFSIPSEWLWVKLSDLIVFGPQNGISPKETKNEDSPKALTLTATTSGNFDSRYYKHVDIAEKDCESYWLSSGDFLFQRGNTREYVGMAAIYDGPEKSFVFPDLMIRIRFSRFVDVFFAHLVLISPPLRAYFSNNATGASTTMPKINQTVLLNTPIPLPPLTEQHRIVAKVDELMALCDQLETQLTSTATDSCRLLKAVLHEALLPATQHVA